MKKNPTPLTGPLRQDETSYDTTSVGDAALLAVLQSTEADAETPEAEADAEAETEAEAENKAPETKVREAKAKAEASEAASSEAASSKAKARKAEAPSEARASTEASGTEKTAALLLRLAAQLLAGEIPDDALLPLMNAASAREAIEQARIEGERIGRNAIIEERLRPISVGAPDLNGTPASPHSSRAASIFDLAKTAK